MRRVALIAFAAGVGVFLVLVGVPYLTDKRDFPASITSPPPVVTVTLDVLRPGSTICMGELAADTHSQVARVKVGTFGKPGVPLALTVTGPGYRSTARVPGAYQDNSVVAFPVRPPARDSLVDACVRNEGARKIALYAAADRARSRAAVTQGSKPVGATPAFGFWEAHRRSIAERMPLIAARMAVFRGVLGHAWIMWFLLVLAIVAIPAGIGLALWTGWSARG